MKKTIALFFWFCCYKVVCAQATDTTVVAAMDSLILVTDTVSAVKEDAWQDKKALQVYTGVASYYAQKFEGRKTASGEIFSHKKLTAACNKLPLGTMIRVTNLSNNKSVIVKTNDRLHPKMTRIVDLTMAAAIKLDFVKKGLTRVKVEVLGKNYKKR